AIRALPPSIVSIYVYAYQSFLFNEISSLRVDEMGNDLTTPVNGELVSLLDKKNGQVTKVRYIVNKDNQEMLEEYIKLGKACITIPVIGRKVRVNKENPAWNYYQVLFNEEEIERGFLKKPEFNLDINLNGIYRPLALYPRGFNLIEVIPDDIFPGKQACKISFSLPKGTYATMFLREIMKIDNQYL
ncbi:tRNA pseudouridine(13) synthase TruD, partial [Candidatus Bathyarchaeota archaeon]|nr:tRNA pseudouridine(13) synthase TruD [Candidatus Bathyarchaeota archaeon]